MNRFLSGGLRIGVALMAAGAGMMAVQARDYLSSVGPAPLRYQAPVPAGAAPWKLVSRAAMIDSTNTDSAAAAATNAAVAAVSAPAVSLSVTNQSVIFGAAAAASGGSNIEDILFPPGVLLPESDSTPMISPQILADYLQPAPRSKDQTSAPVVVPVEVGFAPPVAAPPAQSRAVYKSQ